MLDIVWKLSAVTRICPETSRWCTVLISVCFVENFSSCSCFVSPSRMYAASMMSGRVVLSAVVRYNTSPICSGLTVAVVVCLGKLANILSAVQFCSKSDGLSGMRTGES